MTTIPSPPSISPKQMTLLRIVAAMAWADGHLAQEEVEVAIENFSQIFSQHEDHKARLQEELREYLMQNLPLESLVPQLETLEERKLVLKLGYAVIASSARSPHEPTINAEEAMAYAKLVRLLDLSDDIVQKIEDSVDHDTLQGQDWMTNITSDLEQLARANT